MQVLPTVLTLCSLAALWPAAASAKVGFDIRHATFILNEDATWHTLYSSGEWLAPDARSAIASVTVGGRTHEAVSLERQGDGLTLRFADVDTVLRYAVEPADDWVRFTLREIEGARPERIVLLRVPCARLANVGRRLSAVWGEHITVCLMAAGRQVDCSASAGDPPVLTAASQDAPGPRLEGASAALILCPTPDFKAIARRASHEFSLLTNEDADGTPVKDTDLVRGSYWFLSFGEAEVDKVIAYCEQAGIRQVMLGSGSWCTSPGHYLFHEGRYPNGIEGLKAVVAKLHERGILVGMHTFVSKVAKIDPYVTPIPDGRFWKDREMALTAGVTSEQTDIPSATDLREWPGSPVATQKTWEGGVQKHQEVILGDEIVQYGSIGPEGRWDTFLDCKRGAWGTTAAAHPAGAVGYHYGVDGCINGYIIDQETDLMAEVAERIAGIFDACDFDMVYFDGGEDVDRRRFNYYVSNFQEQAMRRFRKRPIVHMGTIMTHLLWHSFARSSTVDTYLNTLNGAVLAGAPVEKWPTVKQHIDKSVAYMLSVRADMVPGELGWFGIWPKGAHTDGLQFDEVEYLMCKSLAYDVPVSLQTGFGEMEAHPLTPEILRIVKAYEDTRLRGHVRDDVRERLREQGADFVMLLGWQMGTLADGGWPQFARVTEVPLVGGTHDVRAYVGTLPGGPAVATLWHYARDGFVVPDAKADEIRVTTFLGEEVSAEVEEGKPVIPVGPTRTTLYSWDLTADEFRRALENAEVRARPVTVVFVQAEDCAETAGEMAKGSAVGVEEPEAFGDVIVCTGRPSPAAREPWYAQYTAEIPHAGRWALWARVRYPSGGDDSFGIVRPGDEVTLSGSQVLGNCGVNEKRWHWTGRGGGVTTVPPGEPIVLNLEPGPFTFRIYAREGPGSAALNPRLDLLCLTDDPMVVPTDEQARERLGQPQ